MLSGHYCSARYVRSVALFDPRRCAPLLSFERDHGRGPPFSARSLRASRCVLARDRRAFERVSVSSAFQPRAGLETETEPGASIETRGDQRSGTSVGRAGTPIAPSEIFSPRICLFGQKCHRNAGIPTGGAGEYRSRDRIDRSRLQDRDARVETRRISKAPQIFEATRKICAQLALFAIDYRPTSVEKSTCRLAFFSTLSRVR